MEFDRRAAKDRKKRDEALLNTILLWIAAAVLVGIFVEAVYKSNGQVIGLLFGVIHFLG